MKRQLLTTSVISLLILGIFAGIFNVIPGFVVNAYGSNWLNGWNFRQQLMWTNSTDIPSGGYQLNFTIYQASGVSSGYECYANGHVYFSDFHDVRVTASDGQTLLAIWNQTIVNGSYATIWFNDNSNWAGSQSIVYVYYGNSNAGYVWSGGAVFDFYWDFYNLTGWTYNGNWQIDPGTDILDSNGSPDNCWCFYPSLTFGDARVIDKAKLSYVGAEPNADWAGLCQRIQGYVGAYGEGYVFNIGNAYGEYIGRLDPDWHIMAQQAVSYDTNWHIQEALTSGSTLSMTYDFANFLTTSYSEWSSGYVGVRHGGSSSYSMYVQWIAVGNYYGADPTVSSWGAESSNPSPTVYGYTDRPYYGPGDAGTLKFWVYNAGTKDIILDNVTLYYPWYSAVGLWGGNVTIVPSTSTVIAPGGNWSYTSSFTVPNDGRISSGNSSISVYVVTNEATASSSIPISLSVPYSYSLQNMDWLLTLLIILVAAIVICTLIIVASIFISARRPRMMLKPQEKPAEHEDDFTKQFMRRRFGFHD